jgi:hypothetical protein
LRPEPLEVVRERPPNFDAIVAVFPQAANPGVIFAYGGKVYAPGETKVTRDLDAHERVHIERQGDDPDGWWDRYLVDKEFRFEEELLAHRAEFQSFCRRQLDAFKRRHAQIEIGRKLASALYGHMITPEQAELAIRSDA